MQRDKYAKIRVRPNKATCGAPPFDFAQDKSSQIVCLSRTGQLRFRDLHWRRRSHALAFPARPWRPDLHHAFFASEARRKLIARQFVRHAMRIVGLESLAAAAMEHGSTNVQ